MAALVVGVGAVSEAPKAALADELKSLRIDRAAPKGGLPGWAKSLLALAVLAGLGWLGWSFLADRVLLPTVETTTVALRSEERRVGKEC